jgi:hypothetical protein
LSDKAACNCVKSTGCKRQSLSFGNPIHKVQALHIRPDGGAIPTACNNSTESLWVGCGASLSWGGRVSFRRFTAMVTPVSLVSTAIVLRSRVFLAILDTGQKPRRTSTDSWLLLLGMLLLRSVQRTAFISAFGFFFATCRIHHLRYTFSVCCPIPALTPAASPAPSRTPTNLHTVTQPQDVEN